MGLLGSGLGFGIGVPFGLDGGGRLPSQIDIARGRDILVRFRD